MPSSLLPLFDRLEKQRLFYTSKVQYTSEKILQLKPAPDQWSAAQLFYHLWKVDEVVVNSIVRNMESGRPFKKVSFNTRYRSFLLNLFLRLPLKFKVPKLLGDIPDQVDPGQVDLDWQTTRLRLKQLLEEYPEEKLNTEIFKHPRAGMITLPQTLTFLIEHAEHHRNQMKRLLP